jgi:hypothetical protein
MGVSHVVTIRTRVRDPDAVASAWRRLGLPERGTVKLFGVDVIGLPAGGAGLNRPAPRAVARR